MNATTQRYAAFAPTDPALRAYVNPVGYYPPSDPVAGDLVAGGVCTFVGSLDDAEAVVAKDNALRQPITIADVLYASHPSGNLESNVNATTQRYKITDIQLFACSQDVARSVFSANIAISDSFMIQRGTDGAYSIPRSNEATWNNEHSQDQASETLDAAELASLLDCDAALAAAADFEGNWH